MTFFLCLAGISGIEKGIFTGNERFHIVLIFSRSNYLAGSGNVNFDNSLDRIKLATGKRLHGRYGV
jgi:hypothetical protein